MGTTGLIFTAIAIAWLAYLVPHFARRRDDETVEDPSRRFSDSVRIVKHGTAPLLDQDLAEIESYEVSTPLTRRAAIDDLRRLERLAAKRRRRVLVFLMLAVTAVVSACVLGYLPWWSVAIPSGLLLGFFVVARLSVRAMRRSLDRRYQAVCGGSEESTVFFSRKELVEQSPVSTPLPAGSSGKLWDPVPITVPNYVSKPLAPRTVRTIDLAGPAAAPSRPQIPVTADAPPAPETAEEPGREGEDDLRTAVSA